MGNPSRRGKAARSFIDEKRQDETTGAAKMPHKRAGHMSNEMKKPNGREIRPKPYRREMPRIP
jgi:hypothetical protein